MSSEAVVAHAAVGRRPLGPVTAGLCIALVKLAVRVLGFRRTLKIIEWSTRDVALDRTPTQAEVRRAARKVIVAAALYPGRAKCLEQSLVLYLSLRRMGIDARLRLGVQSFPFAAHAWVEVNGEPVWEDPEMVQGFAALSGSIA